MQPQEIDMSIDFNELEPPYLQKEGRINSRELGTKGPCMQWNLL